MSDLIPELHQVIGGFMIALGICLALITIQLVKNHNKR